MIVTVSQLNQYIKGVIDLDGILSNCEVTGEISNARSAHGNWYFSLKDDNSSIDCFMYGSICQSVENGQSVTVKGTANFWTKSGRLSIAISSINQIGKGLQHEKLLQLRDKLDKLGLFDPSRKRNLPFMPKNIGIVTSRDGAVIVDMSKVIRDRQPFSNMLLCSSKVQGDDAPQDIIKSIKALESSNVDVIIIARGGGSNDDLQAFNNQDVVMGVANCSKPTISAIGHGIDTTLCDMVADATAITPTEAGIMATADCRVISSEVMGTVDYISSWVGDKINDYKANTYSIIDKLSQAVMFNLRHAHDEVINSLSDISNGINLKLNAVDNSIKLAISNIDGNNPIKVLSRGYAKVYSGDKAVTSVKELNVEENVRLQLADGQAIAIVKEIN